MVEAYDFMEQKKQRALRDLSVRRLVTENTELKGRIKSLEERLAAAGERAEVENSRKRMRTNIQDIRDRVKPQKEKEKVNFEQLLETLISKEVGLDEVWETSKLGFDAEHLEGQNIPEVSGSYCSN